MIRACVLAALVTLGPTAPAAATGRVEMTARDTLRADLAGMVAGCWAIGGLPPAAQTTVVTLAVEMTPEGLPRPDTIRLVRARGGAAPDVRMAYEAARRAILRCAGQGYDLPRDLHGLWREVEMTFDANRHLM